MENRWYAVYTRSRWEKKVAAAFTAAAIENYCPLNKVTRQWSDRRKIVEAPLFTSYVFVRINAKQHTAVREVDGVLNLVYWLGKPAVIRDQEIELIKEFLKQHQDVKIIREKIRENDKVRINSGAFNDFEARVISVSGRTVKVLLPSLGCSMTANIKYERIGLIQ
jgi:transcription antitermination factor NusG